MQEFWIRFRAALRSENESDIEAAFNQCARQYGAKIFFVAFKYLGSEERAKDVCQDVFEALWRGRKLLIKVDNLEAYFFRTARNITFQAFKDFAREEADQADLHDLLYEYVNGVPVIPDVLAALFDVVSLDGLVDDLSEEDQRRLELLKELSDEDRLLMKLKYVDKLSYAELAERYGVKANTIAKQVWRIKRRLKKRP